jgi:oxygen-independent coproporphyrinogen-3 oxidase
VEAQMAEAERIGLIERDHEWIRPTPKGRRFLNELLERFIPGETAAKPVIPIASTPSRGSRAS